MNDRDYVGIARRYADQVILGELPACRWVRLACERQVRDLGRRDWPWRFDKEKANRICRFIERLPHIKGRWPTRTIKLQDWQCFSLTTVFGWVNKQGLRRFRTSYVEVPRKNGKTSINSGIGLYLLAADGEIGPEIYAAAVTKDQVTGPSGVWTVAHTMAKRTPDLLDWYSIEPLAHSIVIPSNAGYFKPLARDSDTLEGLNVHGAIIDELHAHKTREVFDVVTSGTGSRRQRLVSIITTAGADKTGICYEQRDYVCQVLQGRHEDERYYGIIYSIDPEDDWTLRASWVKANPNFGVSVLEVDLEDACRLARSSAGAQNNFLTKRLGVWVTVGEAYFNMLVWENRCKANIVEADFEGCECVFGLDLASKIDIAALTILFRKGRKYALFGRFWLPSARLDRGQPNYDFYAGWARDGRIELTEGDVIDFEQIEEALIDLNRRFRPREIAFDPYQATELQTRMRKVGLPMVEVGATVRNFSEPMKEMGALILSGNLQHDGNPVLGWMVGNVRAKIDLKDNVFPRKETAASKIDGTVATIMALSRMLPGSSQESAYEKMAVV